MTVEVCANSVRSALNAQAAGADRLEICTELGVGGLTPSYGMLLQMKEAISIPMHVLIRPRSGDFTYSDHEFNAMLEDIRTCVKLGFNGIVSGVLDLDGNVDRVRTSLLLESSSGLPFTFHRAFDWTREPMQALEVLEGLGVTNILTSGQASTAIEGLSLLKDLLNNSNRCHIIPAAGIRSGEALELKDCGFSSVHLSGVRMLSKMHNKPYPSMNTFTLLDEEKIALTDPDTIRQLVKTVK